MPVENEAFLDLEKGLAAKIQNGWEAQVDALADQVVSALDSGQFDTAHELVNSLSFAPVVAEVAKVVKLFASASVLLGASRYTEPKDSFVNANLPKNLIAAGIGQLENMLAVNATQAVLLQTHILLDSIEFKGRIDSEVIEKRDLRSTAFRFNTVKAGKGLIDLGASMLVSRLSSAGALMEADSLGYKQYRVSEVIDKRTCPVCQTMDGKVFPVSSGLDTLGNILSSTDPDHLRHVAPWPKQDKDSVATLRRQSNLELVEGGLALPPYHPLCRGIVTVEEAAIPTSSLGTLRQAPIAPPVPTASAAAVSDYLFGDRKDLQTEAATFFGVGGTSAFLT